MASPQHVVFMNIAATGHMNPTLPVVAELCRRGNRVSYFVEDTMRGVVEASGAVWYPFRFPNDDRTGTLFELNEAGIAELVPEGTPKEQYLDGIPSCLVYDAREMLPALLEDLRGLSPPPTAIVYEPFLAAAPVAAHVLGLPAVSLFTMMGPGVMSKSSEAMAAFESRPWVRKPREDIRERYGFDIFERGMLLEWYSPVENIVATIDELFVPPLGEVQKQRFGSLPFRCVGSLIDTKGKRIANANKAEKKDTAESVQQSSELDLPLPWARLDTARAEGRPILYISLGTVATGPFWKKPFGPFAGGNDDLPHAGRGLADYTGQEFCQHVWRTCFEAFGGIEDGEKDEEGDRREQAQQRRPVSPLVVMSLGREPDALEGMPPAPPNFILRRAVPQLEVLQRCDAFVTHGGANSVHEGLRFGVPLAVVPIFGDQPPNADAVARSRAGVSFRHPLGSLSPSTLRETSSKLLEASTERNSYRAAAREMAVKIEGGGGAVAAADTILKHASAATAAALPHAARVAGGA